MGYNDNCSDCRYRKHERKQLKKAFAAIGILGPWLLMFIAGVVHWSNGDKLSGAGVLCLMMAIFTFVIGLIVFLETMTEPMP